jgi:NTE family protein
VASKEDCVFVFQGGGALGSYQAGAAEALAANGILPGWIAGVSIGAINAAILCGNPPARRSSKLTGFWEKITSGPASIWPEALFPNRRLYSEFAAMSTMMWGAPGFFQPRPPLTMIPPDRKDLRGVYDTAPLRETLEEVVDFDYLNEKGPRLSVGAVNVETGNFAYFDSIRQEIRPEHIMASGALPPGFPPVEVDGQYYWDGGLVSNTPLQYVLQKRENAPILVFQLDLFPARGKVPGGLDAIQQREKDIRYSSRTRLTTDRFCQLQDLRAAAERLAAKLPKEFGDDPDLALLRSVGAEGAATLVHLIYRNQPFEHDGKDYEFSRQTMRDHWRDGAADVREVLSHPDWKNRSIGVEPLTVFDLVDRSR